MFAQTKRIFLLVLLIAILTMACNIEEFLIQPTSTPLPIVTLAVTLPPPTLTPIPTSSIFD